jgi:hypothetical protein
MSETPNYEHPWDGDLRESSIFEPPIYNLKLGPDKALQWDPPANSDELAIALSYHFPLEETLKDKMQAAIKQFLGEAGRSNLGCGKLSVQDKDEDTTMSIAPNVEARRMAKRLRKGSYDDRCFSGDQVSMLKLSRLGLTQSFQNQNRRRAESTRSPLAPIPGLLSFNSKTGEEVKIKRKKRPYEPSERTKVGANRGYACEVHRRQKLKVRRFHPNPD